MVTCRSLCGRRDTSEGQVADLFCSILPTATGCIRYTERLWGMGAPQELLAVSCQNSARRAAHGTRAVGAHEPMIANSATYPCTHARFSRQICQQILVSACRSLCGRRDTCVGQVTVHFCSIPPTATSCIRYTERLWGPHAPQELLAVSGQKTWCGGPRLEHCHLRT